MVSMSSLWTGTHTRPFDACRILIDMKDENDRFNCATCNCNTQSILRNSWKTWTWNIFYLRRKWPVPSRITICHSVILALERSGKHTIALPSSNQKNFTLFHSLKSSLLSIGVGIYLNAADWWFQSFLRKRGLSSEWIGSWERLSNSNIHFLENGKSKCTVFLLKSRTRYAELDNGHSQLKLDSSVSFDFRVSEGGWNGDFMQFSIEFFQIICPVQSVNESANWSQENSRRNCLIVE